MIGWSCGCKCGVAGKEPGWVEKVKNGYAYISHTAVWEVHGPDGCGSDFSVVCTRKIKPNGQRHVRTHKWA